MLRILFIVVYYVNPFLVCYVSFWAETIGGRLISRVKSKKSPCVSIMRDWQRQSYLARQRVLHPEHFLETKQQTRYTNKFDTQPAYLSEHQEILLTESREIRSSLNLRQQRELKNFVEDHDLDPNLEPGNDATEHVVYYGAMVLNSMQVRTKESEVGLKTRDSVVCGRHCVDGDSDDSDDEVRYEYFFGTVRHILEYGVEVIVYVDWFKVFGTLGDDQLGGLAIIPVRTRSASMRSNGWIHANNLQLQQHVLVGKVTDPRFYVVVKI